MEGCRSRFTGRSLRWPPLVSWPRSVQITALAVALGLVAGACSEQADPTSANDAGITSVTTTANARVTHHVSVGGPDVCEALGAPTGCDANLSLTASEKADGSVSGQWQDSFGHGNGGFHATIDCLSVAGNEAWVSGVITSGNFQGFDLTGLPVINRFRDNGTSANDPADQISFSQVGNATSCLAQPAFGLFDLAHGQVKVR